VLADVGFGYAVITAGERGGHRITPSEGPSASASTLLDRDAAEPAIAVMHDDQGGAVHAGEAVGRALGVCGARVHRRGLVVIGSADSPHATATGHNMHAPLGS
jgi:hypothetical protein